MLFFKLQQWRGKTWFHALGYRRPEWKLRPKWRPSVAADRPPCVSWARWHLCAATPPRWRNPCPRDPWKPLAKEKRGCVPMCQRSQNPLWWTTSFWEMCLTFPSCRPSFCVTRKVSCIRLKVSIKNFGLWHCVFDENLDICYGFVISNFRKLLINNFVHGRIRNDNMTPKFQLFKDKAKRVLLIL